MSELAAAIAAYKVIQRAMNVGPDRPKWVKGANGLWHSFDPVTQRRRERLAARAAKEAAKLAKAA